MTNTYTKLISRRGRNKASDECFTPANEVSPLFPFMNKNLTYYECTSGVSSSLLTGLRDGGFNVVGSEGVDFFTCGPDDVHDAIITNPPYSLKDKFLEHCYALGKPFAILLPVTAFQGQKRGRMFIENGISTLVLNRRIDFTGKNAPTFGVAWFMGNGFAPEENRLYFVDN